MIHVKEHPTPNPQAIFLQKYELSSKGVSGGCVCISRSHSTRVVIILPLLLMIPLLVQTTASLLVHRIFFFMHTKPYPPAKVVGHLQYIRATCGKFKPESHLLQLTGQAYFGDSYSELAWATVCSSRCPKRYQACFYAKWQLFYLVLGAYCLVTTDY